MIKAILTASLFGLMSTASASQQGSFAVCANSSVGNTFRNSLSFGVEISFFATGSWTIGGGNWFGAEGFSAPGYPGYRGYPHGGLMMRSPQGYETFAGPQSRVFMQPNEIVSLYMNDDTFNDNSGCLNISWFCPTCP